MVKVPRYYHVVKSRGRGGVEGGQGYRLAHGLIRERASEWCVCLCVTVRIEKGCEKGGGVYPKC